MFDGSRELPLIVWVPGTQTIKQKNPLGICEYPGGVFIYSFEQGNQQEDLFLLPPR